MKSRALSSSSCELSLLLLLAVVALISSSVVSAASMQQVQNFGANPGNLRMFVYVPDNVKPKPPIVVGLHNCGGNANSVFTWIGGDMVSAANKYGFMMVMPEVTRQSDCFDVSSDATLTHLGGSDSLSIYNMVQYAINTWHGDAARVYAFGLSSGAMMTNVLMGSYPDLFAAGAVLAGVPFHCFYTGSVAGWNSQCSGGTAIHTPAEWAAYVRKAFPSYTGAYPRMQLFHGTADDTLRYPNFGEELKQWTAVHALSQTPTFTDKPQSSWTRTRYGGSSAHEAVEGISVQGAGHGLPLAGMINMMVEFFGLPAGGIPRGSGGDTPIPTPTSGTCVKVAESQNATVSCGSGSVVSEVTFASYGTPGGDCSSGLSRGSCDAVSSLSTVQASCVGRASCVVPALNSVFGDPCSGTLKSLAVLLSCAAPLSADLSCGSIAEHGALTLGCAAGKRITKINFASYGTPSGTCSGSSFATVSTCHSSSSQSVVEAACLNKNRCTVSAENSAFGDPCSGITKQLAVTLTCTS